MHFSKMHSLGNDFLIVDATAQDITFSSELICFLANRHTGIGFDQFLIVESSRSPNFDFYYRIFNRDGVEVSQCGNGACCFASFVYLKRLTSKRNILVSTSNGRSMVLNIINEELVCVNIGEPNFEPSSVPFITKKRKKKYVLKVKSYFILFNVVSLGNPHCIIKVNNVQTTAVEEIGSVLEKHKRFPERINVIFMQIIRRNHIRLRVYERGVGETLACGSGACAAVAVGIMQNLLAEKVIVDLPGGRLRVSWKGIGHSIYMTGPSTHVYDGFINLAKLTKNFSK